MNYFNAERRNYYFAKKRDLQRENERRAVIKEDAIFIYHYGMTAFMEFFPESKGLSIEWHRLIVAELALMERKRLGQLLGGVYMASAATKDRKINRKFRKIIADLTRG